MRMHLAMVLEELVHDQTVHDIATERAEGDMHILVFLLVEKITHVTGRQAIPSTDCPGYDYVVVHIPQFISSQR